MPHERERDSLTSNNKKKLNLTIVCMMKIKMAQKIKMNKV